MRRVLLFLIFFLPYIYAENVVIGEINLKYTISGEMTNNNPYPIFIALPDEYVVINTYKTLPLPNSGYCNLDIYQNSTNATYYLIKPELKYMTIFNGKKGFWLPPYTTVKLKMILPNISYALSINIPDEHNFRSVGPAICNKYGVIKLDNIYPNAKRDNIILDNFKLTVYGCLKLNDYSNAYSLIIPAPITFDEYKDIVIIPINDVDDKIWINYYDWLNGFMKVKRKKKLLDDYSDNGLLIDDLDINLDKNYPALAFTTTSTNQNLEFYYIVYWKRKSINLPDILD
ncbi:hypothetical protein J422_05973 [Methanocaldococcus villosus KIN24-T80]|uniref:Uncharacterized protein n=1 Tax=Methanocaldococcus villosus KIN24-T80 TaxID=1069083 RepID=N6V0D3_9EURY|nr:hypothetical protein [Methanocaldococcus villosus]ENN95783.1 hypothetical protein J422_05973 [Methanocaldococcus villosus KIN24-T80]